MPGQPAAAPSRPGTCALAGLRGHLIQRPQQPQPASEPDLLPRAGPGMLPGSADDPKTAGRRIGPVQDDTDLHTPIVPAPADKTISQLADARDAGAATSYERLDHRPQPSAPGLRSRQPAPAGEADPGRQPPPSLTHRSPTRRAPGPIAGSPSCPGQLRCRGWGRPAGGSILPEITRISTTFTVPGPSGHEIGQLADAMTRQTVDRSPDATGVVPERGRDHARRHRCEEVPRPTGSKLPARRSATSGHINADRTYRPCGR